MTTVHKLDPIRDRRWQAFVEGHPNGSVFHTSAWLEALRQTYNYQPVVFTTSAPTGDLSNGLLFCRVRSWLTSLRMVSLPFSDYCDPLCTSEETEFLTRYLQCELDHQNWKYLEIRPLTAAFRHSGDGTGFQAVAKYRIHRMDLRDDLQGLFSTLDKNSVQRRIHRAERSGLTAECGRSEKLLRDFFRLSILTRRRHHLPPQPFAWFKNLIQSFGDALQIRTAYMGTTPVASILTLRFRETAYYKYGSSDAKFHYLGAMPFLLWQAVVEAKSAGATVFDMGRTDPADVGLVAFKDKWVHQSEPLVYWKFPIIPEDVASLEWKLNFVKRVFSHTPNRLLTVAGRLIYPHIG